MISRTQLVKMTTIHTRREVYLRNDPKFKTFIESLLYNYTLVPFSNISYYTQPQHMDIFQTAFTHPSYTQQGEDNYEFLEILGDVTVNKSIVWYLQNRYPHLKNQKGVSTLSQLKANLVSSKSLSSFAENLGFWSFVRMNEVTRTRNKKKVLEDVFEAFIAALEMVVDNCNGPFTGYGVCYKLISKILDKTHISLSYTDLKDAKTRLKEIFDKNVQLSNLEYQRERNEEGVFNINVIGEINGEKYKMGSHTGLKAKPVEKVAAGEAIKWINKNLK